MSVSYSSLTGIQGDPLTYLSELATAGKNDLDSTGVSTRIVILLAFIVIMILYYFLFSSLGNNGNGTASSGSGSGTHLESGGKQTLEIILWSIFILLLVINGFQYFFNVNITASIRDVFTDKPKIDVTVQEPPSENVVPELKIEKEVYNIPDNRFTYDDSKAICQAYGGGGWLHITKLRKYTIKELSGVIMGGLMIRWCFFQHNKKRGINYRQSKDTKMIVVDQVLTADE